MGGKKDKKETYCKCGFGKVEAAEPPVLKLIDAVVNNTLTNWSQLSGCNNKYTVY